MAAHESRDRGEFAALAQYGLDKLAGTRQLLRAYEATRRMDPRMATPGGREAQKAFNAMARSVGGHRNMPRALGEMGSPEGMTLPISRSGRRITGANEALVDVNQLFSRKRDNPALRGDYARIPPSELASYRKQLWDFIRTDPYEYAARDFAEYAARDFARGGVSRPYGLSAEQLQKRVAQKGELYKAMRPEVQKELLGLYGRTPAADPRDLRELISGRHVPKGVDREKAVLVRPEELPHEPYSVQWKGGVPLPRNAPPNTPVWSSGYPTVSGGYATKKVNTGNSSLRAYPIDPSTARYTPHVARDVRALPEAALQKLTQQAGRSASGALPHYERVTSHRDLGSPVAVFKPVGDGRFQQVLGAPMPRVGSGIGDL